MCDNCFYNISLVSSVARWIWSIRSVLFTIITIFSKYFTRSLQFHFRCYGFPLFLPAFVSMLACWILFLWTPQLLEDIRNRIDMRFAHSNTYSVTNSVCTDLSPTNLSITWMWKQYHSNKSKIFSKHRKKRSRKIVKSEITGIYDSENKG